MKQQEVIVLIISCCSTSFISVPNLGFFLIFFRCTISHLESAFSSHNISIAVVLLGGQIIAIVLVKYSKGTVGIML